MKKEKIVCEKVEKLLLLARKRKTNQGISIYEDFLRRLATAFSPAENKELLVQLNRTLASIEAHGGFGKEEYSLVKELRLLEEEDSE